MKKIFFYLFICSSLFFASLTSIVFGDSGPISTIIPIENPIAANSLQELLATILQAFVRIGIPIAVLFLVYAGFLFVKAQGNPEELNTAKRAFLWTLVGVAVLFGAEVLANIISGTIEGVRNP